MASAVGKATLGSLILEVFGAPESQYAATLEERGRDAETAEEIAARTVNKERREEGETKSQRRDK